MTCPIVRKCGVAGKAMALTALAASASGQADLQAVAVPAWRMDGPVLRQAVQTGEPFTVAGPQGVLVGQQQGLLESWILPVKLLSHMTLEAEVEGYPVPLDLNTMAREIAVRPDRTTIVYSHIAVTVRQTMFAPQDAPEGTGAVVLFQVDAVRPVTLTLRFTPELREMWPKPSSETPSAEWVEDGMYVLHTDFQGLAGAVALPGARSGVMAPYQERPQVHPLELIWRFDPVRDRGKIYPLLMAVGTTVATASNAALEGTLQKLNARLTTMYAAHAQGWARREAAWTSIVTPDAGLNADLAWAEASIWQLQARLRPTSAEHGGEVGLVAGYYASGDSARPGFGWFFGRDTLYTVYAIDSYGDFGLARTALEFLLRRQRADGKVMHEYSQTAGEVDWASLPYEYAAADATPLLLTAMLDYVRASGDVAFLKKHGEAVEKAWQFETTHDADGDGIYDNAQGTGWVESWPGGMPKQEIYLALLDEQASRAMKELAGMLGDEAVSAAAGRRAETLRETIEREYYRAGTDSYEFSRNAGGTTDWTSTVFPAVAWWNGGAGLEHAAGTLRRWASHEFATDWGLRDVAESEPIYDATSYHQGSVWPLYTGWAALAQYRSGHELAGYQALMQNADLTRAQDPGAVTELLSGAFFEPFGRSTSHQLWSSAMVATPLLRGMFGIEVDAVRGVVKVAPHLPADWPGAEVKGLRVGASVVNLSYTREGAAMVVKLTPVSGAAVHLAGGSEVVRVPLPALELSIAHGLPERGARTAMPKVVDEIRTDQTLRVEVEGVAGTSCVLGVRRNGVVNGLTVEGAELRGDQLKVSFGAGSVYVTRTITLSWQGRS